MTDLDRIVNEIAARQHGVFALDQVPDATESEIRTRSKTARWKRINRRVLLVEGSPDTWEQRLWVKLCTAGAGAVVGSRAAAALHGARGMRRTHIDVIQPAATVPNLKAPTSRWSNNVPPWHVTVIEGFPVTTMERTIFDLAGLTTPARRRRGGAYVPADLVERTLDNAITDGLVSIRSLTMVFLSLAGRGRPGTRLMRELLEVRGDGFVVTESVLEDRFVALVAEFGLPEPKRQVQVGSDGTWIGRIDFLFDAQRLVVETDGRRYHSGRIATQQDHRRDLELLAAGWQILRIDWWQLENDRHDVARLLQQILNQRTTT